jgi:hypothetical protein
MRVIKLETLQAGQPRAYADSIYKHRMTFEHTVQQGADQGKLTPDSSITAEKATDLCREYYGYPTDPEWYEISHRITEAKGVGVFEITFIRVFLD